MSDLKLACWNIFFSHKFVEGTSGSYSISSDESTRFDTVIGIIKAINADLLGIVECMAPWHLRYVRDNFLPDYEIHTEGRSSKLNLGLLYNPSRVEVTPLDYDRSAWNANIGYGGSTESYKFSRTPLVVGVRDLSTDERFAMAVVHMKSKKTYTNDRQEPFRNRKKIVAQSLRTREIMAAQEAVHSDYKRFFVLGDVNDGPGFDKYEAKIVVSGIESLLGSVFDPKNVYVSFTDLSDGGIPTTPFSGAPQLDHILYSQSAERPGGIRIKEGTGRVRSDLVDFGSGSGKDKDSDHAPVELVIRS